MGKLFIVGENVADITEYLGYSSTAWEFVGIYSDRDVAISHCIRDGYFVYEVELDGAPMHEPHVKAEVFYPKK